MWWLNSPGTAPGAVESGVSRASLAHELAGRAGRLSLERGLVAASARAGASAWLTLAQASHGVAKQSLLPAGESVDGAPLLLGRAAGARLPLGIWWRPLLFASPSRDRRREVGIERLRQIGGTAANRKAGDLEHAHSAIKRHRHDVTGPHRLGGRQDASAVDAHVTGGRKRRRGAARAHDAGVPQPLVHALAIVAQSARVVVCRCAIFWTTHMH